MNRYDRLRTADLAQCGDDMAYQIEREYQELTQAMLKYNDPFWWLTVVFKEAGFTEVERNPNDVALSIELSYCNNYYEDMILELLNTLVPFTAEGFISYRGEEGDLWCHVFAGGEWTERSGRICYAGHTGRDLTAAPGGSPQGFDSAGGAPRHDLLRYGLPEEQACGKRIQELGDFAGEIGYHIRYLFMGSRPQWFGRLHLGVLPESGQGSRVAVDSGAFCECLAVFTHFVAKTHFAQCNEVPRKIRSGSSCCFPLTMVIRP